MWVPKEEASIRLQSRLKYPSPRTSGSQEAGVREGARIAAKLRAGVNGRAAWIDHVVPFRLLLIGSGFYSKRVVIAWGR